MKNSKFCTLAAMLMMSVSLFAQNTDGDEVPFSINASTLFGVGGYNIQDTYLTPGEHANYKGAGLRILNERMKMTHLCDEKISRQQIISADMASTNNGGGTATDFTGFVDYSLAYHYQFQLDPQLKLLAGAAVHAMGGFIYNTRNGNNPATGKIDADLDISALGIWQTRIGKLPLVIRLQADIPFAGVLFSPHYGQSYYEIFNLGNNSGIVKFSSFHNKLAMKNYLTVDFPISKVTMRLGYIGSWYQSDVNGIHDHIISHSFMVGFVKEFISFGGRRIKNPDQYRSAFY